MARYMKRNLVQPRTRKVAKAKRRASRVSRKIVRNAVRRAKKKANRVGRKIVAKAIRRPMRKRRTMRRMRY